MFVMLACVVASAGLLMLKKQVVITYFTDKNIDEIVCSVDW